MSYIVICNEPNEHFNQVYRKDHPIVKGMLWGVKNTKKVNIKDMHPYLFDGSKNDLMILKLQGKLTGHVCHVDVNQVETAIQGKTDAHRQAIENYNDCIKRHGRCRDLLAKSKEFSDCQIKLSQTQDDLKRASTDAITELLELEL